MDTPKMDAAPRIYNLFPLLVGDVTRWEAQLPRVAAMGFDWVFVNPFHYPGFSGSLYAVKDYYSLHPLFRGHSHRSPDAILRHFLAAAEHHRLKVMMDLVVNHTAKDSVLVAAHPEWFAREADGSIRSPYAADPQAPGDPARRTLWGDLAEVDYRRTRNRAGLVRYWQDLVRHHAELGFAGFRGDAAYKVPGEVWEPIIAAARELNPEVRFFAETLGCQAEEVFQLQRAGFDFLFNSSKWWDFQAPWLLEQYQAFRRIAPSIAFPESHDSERLAAESGGDERVSRLRYLFAAVFSSGVMVPLGYEYGFRRKMDVVHSRPADWEPSRFDLSGFISRVNHMKATTGPLNEDGPQRRIDVGNAGVVALLREGDTAPGRILILINPDLRASRRLSARVAGEILACPAAAMRELLPGPPSPARIDLPPASIRLFAAA